MLMILRTSNPKKNRIFGIQMFRFGKYDTAAYFITGHFNLARLLAMQNSNPEHEYLTTLHGF